MESRWDDVFIFLTERKYPQGLSKGKKINLKRYAQKFTVKDGELFFKSRRAIKSRDEAWTLFEEFHCAPFGGHPGIIKTRHAMCSKFYWHGMSVHIDSWVSKCAECQRGRKPRENLKLCQASSVWEMIVIDLEGPLPKTTDGHQYILTAVDCFSKWTEAFPLKSKSVAEVGQRLCSMIYRHGCPKRILSDQGHAFVNELNNTLCGLLNIEKCFLAVYNPQANDLDKKTNCSIKRALTKLVNERRNHWDTFLEATMFFLRTKVHPSNKRTPFKLMYGREAVFPPDASEDDLPPAVIPKQESEEMKDTDNTEQNNMVES